MGIKDGPRAKLAAAKAKLEGKVTEEAVAAVRSIRGQKFPYLIQQMYCPQSW